MVHEYSVTLTSCCLARAPRVTPWSCLLSLSSRELSNGSSQYISLYACCCNNTQPYIPLASLSGSIFYMHESLVIPDLTQGFVIRAIQSSSNISGPPASSLPSERYDDQHLAPSVPWNRLKWAGTSLRQAFADHVCSRVDVSDDLI